MIIFILSSCATPPKERLNTEKINEDFINNSKLKYHYQEEKELENIKLNFIELSPLDRKKVSISVKDQDYKELLFFIAKEAGINIVFEKDIDKYIPKEEKYLTLELKNLTLREALETILGILNLDYEIDNGILKIIATQERFFHLDFLPYLRSSKFDLGGDVLGSQTNRQTTQDNEEIITPLKGNIETSGKINDQHLDIYALLEKNIKNLLSKEGKYTLNRYSGTLYVKDRCKNVKNIEKFINFLKEKYQKQVLIEAKILEVNLNKSSKLGINWDLILKNDLKDTAYISNRSSFLWDNSETFLINFKVEPYFNSILNAISKQGTLKIISNPRIRVMHGQPALIGVGKSISYIREVDRETTAYEGVTTVETTVDTSAVFDGLLFEVTPFINNDNTITLHIVPIKSDVIELKNVKFEDYEITLPQINLRETSTVIRTKENDLIVISGLIMNKKSEINYNVPKISKIPIIGNIFKSKEKEDEKVELIILLKTKII